MRRLRLIFACLLLALSFGGGAVAHALEVREIAGVAATQTVAVPQTVAASVTAPDEDRDSRRGKADAAYVHHHGGCHADHVAAPAKCAPAEAVAGSAATPFAATVAARPGATADPTLRPPRA